MEAGPLPSCVHTPCSLALQTCTPRLPAPALQQRRELQLCWRRCRLGSPRVVPHLPIPLGPTLAHPGGSGQIQGWDSQTRSPAQARGPKQRFPILEPVGLPLKWTHWTMSSLRPEGLSLPTRSPLARARACVCVCVHAGVVQGSGRAAAFAQLL